MGKWKHKLSNKDLENKTADCSNCGQVRIGLKGNKQWYCKQGAADYKALYRYKDASPKPKECEICGSTKRICYDHNHQSGIFRGWLCNACNVALGCVSDNPETLRKLADYLEK